MKPYSPTGDLKNKILECINMPHSDVKVQTVVSTAKEHKYKWKFITEDNAPRYWFAKEFDDSLWPKGTAAFGRSSVWTTQGIISIPWTTEQIYLRRWFYLGDVTQEMIDCMRFIMTMTSSSISTEFGLPRKKVLFPITFLTTFPTKHARPSNRTVGT